MSDDNIEPGAPTAEAADESTDKVTSKEISVPKSVPSIAKQADHLILRLNKLLASPGGQASFLGTLNYTLYLLAYLETKTSNSPISALLARLLSKAPQKPSTTTLISAAPATTPIVALAGLISRARTTLRLLGLPPLYAWFRSLQAGPKPDADPVLHKIAMTQCLAYMTYQALENISVLADNGIVPKSLIALLNRGDSSTARVYLVAYRAWLMGVSCDFVRLGREAHLERRRRAVRRRMEAEGKAVAEGQKEDDEKFNSKWWTEFMVAAAWFPMAMHFSSKGGMPGWNVGVMGLCGLVASSTRSRGLWKATLQ